ncbi:RNA-binding protein [Halapricum desulfuricans]|uniref:Exosome subunit, RNA binding protein with dsRBD fold n=1 Tax=Halapricum desulfuricans TaxID=2841257 RepID=A0A897NGB5_9EURY|nr:RNA-binding protein [Halapricum desulfuricans]QSG08681.1 Exosome subunit, RNA binding protein with dsRBD fold [Halapricum desulfuricans]QSG11628.1 Exosome subunit, RNA binding protein with dsRBD fold [Halapricum desulfuricans]
MSSVPLHYIDLRAFCYATEDDRRVESALRTLLPEAFELQRLENEGHHGDRILVFSARVENADEMRVVLDRLGELPADQRQRLRSELDERVTDNTELFLTLDKQAAFGGDVRLGDGITVRAKVEAYPATKDAAVENARDVLESP